MKKQKSVVNNPGCEGISLPAAHWNMTLLAATRASQDGVKRFVKRFLPDGAVQRLAGAR